MTDTDVLEAPGPAPSPYADAPEPGAQPITVTDAYVELGGVNLKCLVMEIALVVDANPIELTTLCGKSELPGAPKYHLTAKFAQSFDPGGPYEVLSAAYANYVATGALMPYKVRPLQSRGPAAPNNPEFSGFAIPQPVGAFGGTAGAVSEVDIDWTTKGPPTANVGSVTATGATSGAPGAFTPPGAIVPANLAALASVAAAPATAWAAGSYVITADRLGAYWDGTAWAAGVA